MKSPITLAVNTNNGFLTIEIMVAFLIMTILLTSAMVLSATSRALHRAALLRLENVAFARDNISSSTLSTAALYGNDTQRIALGPLVKMQSNFNGAWGRDSCLPRASFTLASTTLHREGIMLGTGNASTDIEVRDGIAYVSADSSTASLHDLYIIDLTNPENPNLISSLNTGPGLHALEVAGQYIYAANLGTTNQLQVIDIANRSSPIIVARYKLPLPQASSTAPFAMSIFYNQGLIYLGTEKWEGNEFSVIDVTVPAAPVYLGGFETNTQINSIYVRENYAYLAASDSNQMIVLSVGNPQMPQLVGTFSPSGWETQQGRILSYFEGRISLGRNTGGFNVVENHEIFSFSTTSPLGVMASRDVPGGVYGIIEKPGFWLLSTKSPGHELQLWNEDFSLKKQEMDLGFFPVAMGCDGNTLFFATGDDRGVAILESN